MPKNELKRDYIIGDDVLMQKADSLVAAMQRDATDFATRLVDATRINEIVNQSTALKNHPTDEELLGHISSATETKNDTVLKLRQRIATVRNMAATKFGNNGKFKTFAFGELSSLPDSDLYRTARRVVRVGTSFLADLASEGLTAALLTEITTLADKLDRQIDEMEAAIENRDIKTQERVVLGNTLWNTMVKYANVGKSLYEFTDEARYNDYVLTESVDNGGDAPETPTP